MAYLSMTRLKLRSPTYLLPFTLYTIRSIRQVQRTPGFIKGKVIFTANLSGWTALLWEAKADIRAYVSAGAHGEAMNYIQQWTSEAVHGHKVVENAAGNGIAVPDWRAIAPILAEMGYFHSLPFASPYHLNHVVPEPSLVIFRQSILPSMVSNC